MVQLIGIPGLQYPSNAQLDFAPVQNALNSYRQASDRAEQWPLQRNALMQEQDLNRERIAQMQREAELAPLRMDIQRQQLEQQRQTLPLQLEQQRIASETARQNFEIARQRQQQRQEVLRESGLVSGGAPQQTSAAPAVAQPTSGSGTQAAQPQQPPPASRIPLPPPAMPQAMPDAFGSMPSAPGFDPSTARLPGPVPNAEQRPGSVPTQGEPQPAAPVERRTLRQILEGATPGQRYSVAGLFAEGKDEDAWKLIREIEGTPLSARQRAETEEGFRREYATRATPYFEMRDAIGRIEAAPSDGPGDLVTIFNFMKMLDPQSVVRESEFAQVGRSGGLPAQIQGMFNRIIGSGQLSDDVRQSIRRQSRDLLQVQERQYESIQSQYVDIARRVGVDPRNVFIDYRRPPAPHPPASGGAGQAPPSGGPVRITNDTEYRALAPGTVFVGPDNVPREKPPTPQVPQGTP